DAEYRLKPMNCPGHILIYKDSLKSYRNLPVRLGELGTVYRYERSGVMHGLLRVRGFTQDDAHIFCTPEQIEKEIADCVEFARDVLHDFNLPARFGLEYVAEDGTRKQPVMVHRALYGSVERFFGVLIEHYAGAFPVWLSPVQVVMIPIAERHVEYANKVASLLRGQIARLATAHVGTGALTRPAEQGSAENSRGSEAWTGHPVSVRVEVDARNEKMNAKIREHALQKIPFMLIDGDKEAEAGKVNVRTRGKEKTEDMGAEEFASRIRMLIPSKSPMP